MAIRLPGVLAKQGLSLSGIKSASKCSPAPKGFLAVYVGEAEKKRFVVPVSYLNHASVQDLLGRTEEEFGFDHPRGSLMIPCDEDTFLDVTSSLRRS